MSQRLRAFCRVGRSRALSRTACITRLGRVTRAVEVFLRSVTRAGRRSANGLVGIRAADGLSACNVGGKTQESCAVLISRRLAPAWYDRSWMRLHPAHACLGAGRGNCRRSSALICRERSAVAFDQHHRSRSIFALRYARARGRAQWPRGAANLALLSLAGRCPDDGVIRSSSRSASETF